MRSSETGDTETDRARLGRRTPLGFTLLEIMIAVTIFGVISIAVYSTFRVGLRSYESGREQMVLTQSARTVFDLMARDLRSLYYLPPDAYNQNLITQLQVRAMQRLLAPSLPGQQAVRDKNEEKEEKPLVGLPIDLTIIGEDHEQSDLLTFVTYQAYWGVEAIQPWALARVKYYVQDGILFRAEGPITVEQVPGYQWQPLIPVGASGDSPGGWTLPSPMATDNSVGNYLQDMPHEMVARGVKTFDLRYGYWTADGWYESPDWIGHERRYRNPPYPFDPADPQAFLFLQRNLSRATDDIPAYVIVTLELTYGKDGSRSQVFRSRIRLLVSSETYQPFADPALAAANAAFDPRRQATPYGLGPGMLPRR